MKTRICRHIKTNGLRCKSPRLTDRDLCYFHVRIHQRHAVMVQTHAPITTADPAAEPLEIDMPVLEDAESIQVSISLLVAALARNRIDTKRAIALLYGLQLASANAKSIITEPFFSDTVIRNIVQSSFGTDYAEEPEEPVRKSASQNIADDTSLQLPATSEAE